LLGDAGKDTILGGNDPDTIHGGSGTDRIDGGADNDVIFGGTGKDIISGGADVDQFIFTRVKDSPAGRGRDVIKDFVVGEDRIQLAIIDAKRGGSNDMFTFIGKHAFHDKAGELRYKFEAGHTVVQGDVNGDGTADIEIQLSGHHVLHAADFVL
jgi:Ca2+-binding RTX toxin-like protein